MADPSCLRNPIVITNADFRFVVAEQLRERGIAADIVLEPTRRDSGPAVAVAAVLAAERNRDALVLVLAADHVMRSLKNSAKLAGKAAEVAAEGRIVTFGICADSPATNYGYIRPGEKLNGALRARESRHSSKSPTPQPPPSYVGGGLSMEQRQLPVSRRDHAGEIERFEPTMAQAAKAAVEGITRDLDFLRLAPEPFARAPKKSIDHAVMEHTKLAAVVPADIGWSDVGSWNAVWDMLDHDEAGNATDGPVVLMDSRNSLVRSEQSMLTTVIGLDDLIVVSTADAVLVARAQRPNR